MTSNLGSAPSAFGGLVGVGRRDITPPHGIYARNWGRAEHDTSEGTHRPLTVTVLVIRENESASPLLLVAMDLLFLGDFGAGDPGRLIHGRLLKELQLDEARVMIACSHTHSAPWPSVARVDLPGGDLLIPYLERVGEALIDAGREALAGAQPATLTWSTGRSDLAVNRDLPDPDASRDRYVTGYNPAVAPDQTLLVGRVTRDSDNQTIATLVNYACHPTTLAWENRLISPDYIGAMRELVEQHTGGAPCVFLQGASGDLSPAYQYVGDPVVADRHGRRLGFTVLAVLEGMLAPRHFLAFDRVVESGAPLAVWSPVPFDPVQSIEARVVNIDYPLKPWPTLGGRERGIELADSRFSAERLNRKHRIVEALGSGSSFRMPAWVWRVGTSIFVGHPNEAYSDLQVELREAFPDHALVVMNLVNGSIGYLYRPDLHDRDVYQVWQSPFDKASLPLLIDVFKKQVREVLASG